MFKKTFLKLGELFSLNSEKSRITLILIIIITLNLTPKESLRYYPIPSLFDISGLYNYLGFEFYSAYLSRSIYEIFRLNFESAWNLNPLGFIFVLGILIYLTKDIYSLYKKEKIRKK